MSQLLVLPVDQIIPDPNQPRKDFDQISLQELADSINAVGQAQPIRIRSNPDQNGKEKYMIIAGERRWQASILGGRETIECVFVEDELSKDEIYAQQLTENLHRQDLNQVEKAEFIQDRIDYLKSIGVSNAVDTVSKELGVSAAWVSRNTAILKYDEKLRSLARIGKIRDYDALRKVSKLRGEKKILAYDLIEKGEFNAKEFFARKRYEKKADPIIEDRAAVVTQTKTIKEKQPKMAIKIADMLRVIEKTQYSDLLDRNDSNWRLADKEVLHSYISAFIDWCISSDK